VAVGCGKGKEKGKKEEEEDSTTLMLSSSSTTSLVWRGGGTLTTPNKDNKIITGRDVEEQEQRTHGR
jgi:hypothetical protein